VRVTTFVVEAKDAEQQLAAYRESMVTPHRVSQSSKGADPEVERVGREAKSELSPM
jgi:hypothetical protein